jgi:hypothetical protein
MRAETGTAGGMHSRSTSIRSLDSIHDRLPGFFAECVRQAARMVYILCKWNGTSISRRAGIRGS